MDKLVRGPFFSKTTMLAYKAFYGKTTPLMKPEKVFSRQDRRLATTLNDAMNEKLVELIQRYLDYAVQHAKETELQNSMMKKLEIEWKDWVRADAENLNYDFLKDRFTQRLYETIKMHNQVVGSPDKK